MGVITQWRLPSSVEPSLATINMRGHEGFCSCRVQGLSPGGGLLPLGVKVGLGEVSRRGSLWCSDSLTDRTSSISSSTAMTHLGKGGIVEDVNASSPDSNQEPLSSESSSHSTVMGRAGRVGGVEGLVASRSAEETTIWPAMRL